MYCVTINPRYPEERFQALEQRYYRLRYNLVENYLDISNLCPKEHPLFAANHEQERLKNLMYFHEANAQRMGYMKSEVGKKQDQICKSLFLKPKLYMMCHSGIQNQSGECSSYLTKRAKGVKKAFIANSLTESKFYKVLQNEKPVFTLQSHFKTQSHILWHENYSKAALSLCDTKRVWPCKWYSYPINYPFSKKQRMKIREHYSIDVDCKTKDSKICDDCDN